MQRAHKPNVARNAPLSRAPRRRPQEAWGTGLRRPRSQGPPLQTGVRPGGLHFVGKQTVENRTGSLSQSQLTTEEAGSVTKRCLSVNRNTDCPRDAREVAVTTDLCLTADSRLVTSGVCRFIFQNR